MNGLYELADWAARNPVDATIIALALALAIFFVGSSNCLFLCGGKKDPREVTSD